MLILPLVPSPAYYIIGLPLGFYLAFHWDKKIMGLYEGLCIALILVSIAAVWIVIRSVCVCVCVSVCVCVCVCVRARVRVSVERLLGEDTRI